MAGGGTQKSASNPNPSKLGRKGDHRMESALDARLNDESLSLQAALELGGFVFQKCRDGNVYDKDNVRLSQRKNQLSRRVRIYKQQRQQSQTRHNDVKNSQEQPKKRRLKTEDSKSLAIKGTEEQMSNALTYFHAEVATLFKKSLLQAGYKMEQTEECDELYLEFAEKAIEAERRRIVRLQDRLHLMNSSSRQSRSENDSQSHATADMDDQHDHSHNHSHGHDKFLPIGVSNDCVHSRHLHRLEGRCGHKAIIHRPSSGQAHIDFVVDGKVECYQDCKLLTDEAAFWPSKFRCDELKNHVHDYEHEIPRIECDSETCKIQAQPKLIDLNEIDLFGDEWQQMIDADDGRDEEIMIGSLFQLSER